MDVLATPGTNHSSKECLANGFEMPYHKKEKRKHRELSKLVCALLSNGQELDFLDSYRECYEVLA